MDRLRSAAVGNTVLDILERDRMDVRAQSLGEHLRWRLLELQSKHAVVGDIRGRGLLQGLELVLDRETKEGSDEMGAAITQRCLQLGLHMNIVQLPGIGGTFRLAPALTSTKAELDLGVEILDQAITEIAPAFVCASCPFVLST